MLLLPSLSEFCCLKLILSFGEILKFLIWVFSFSTWTMLFVYNKIKFIKFLFCIWRYTHKVPTILLVFAWSSFVLKIRANPKSDIFGFISESKRMLLAFRSLWTILSLECLWRYKSPWAMPSIISKRLSQFRSSALVLSVIQQIYMQKKKKHQGVTIKNFLGLELLVFNKIFIIWGVKYWTVYCVIIKKLMGE